MYVCMYEIDVWKFLPFCVALHPHLSCSINTNCLHLKSFTGNFNVNNENEIVVSLTNSMWVCVCVLRMACFECFCRDITSTYNYHKITTMTMTTTIIWQNELKKNWTEFYCIEIVANTFRSETKMNSRDTKAHFKSSN